MPPLIALAATGAGLYLAGRLVRREMARVARALAEAGRPEPRPVEIKLDRDPRTGIWRMKGPGEV